jgi:hypothetical protein
MTFDIWIYNIILQGVSIRQSLAGVNIKHATPKYFFHTWIQEVQISSSEYLFHMYLNVLVYEST